MGAPGPQEHSRSLRSSPVYTGRQPWVHREEAMGPQEDSPSPTPDPPLNGKAHCLVASWEAAMGTPGSLSGG